MPYLQMAPFVVEHSLASQLHTEDKQTEQLRQSSAEDIESQIHLKAVSQVGEGVFPERTMLVCAIDDARDFIESGMVNLVARQQTVKFHGLDGQQADNAPHPLRRQIADGDEQQTVARIEH